MTVVSQLLLFNIAYLQSYYLVLYFLSSEILSYILITDYLILFLFSAVIYANRHILSLYERTHPHRLAKMSIPSSSNLQMLDDPINSSLVVMNGNCQPSICGPIIIGHVFIHPTASIDRTAVVSRHVIRKVIYSYHNIRMILSSESKVILCPFEYKRIFELYTIENIFISIHA